MEVSTPPAPIRTLSCGLRLLDFTLPPFVRISWTSDVARRIWGPRIARIQRAWHEIEVCSVAEGLRDCAALTRSERGDPDFRGDRWSALGLEARSLETLQGAFGQGTRLVVGRPDAVRAFVDAFERCDDRAASELLGYPSCCYAAYRQAWVAEGLTDMTWRTAAASADPEPGTQTIDLSGPPEVNFMWRLLGIGLLPHQPCATGCRASAELAERLVDLGSAAGFAEELDWIRAILSWPVLWSGLHGIAEIKTPILKIAAQTDATPDPFTVRWQGEAYPGEGAQALQFPYRMPERPLFTSTRAYRRGAEEVLGAAASRQNDPQ